MADLDILRNAGMNIDGMSTEEQDALSRLDETELQALASIRGKLNEEPDVSGHAVRRAAGDGGFVW